MNTRCKYFPMMILAAGAAWGQNLVVTSFGGDAVVLYNLKTRALVKTITHPKLKGPFAAAFGPDGNLYVSSSGVRVTPDGNLVPLQGADFTNEVLRFNGTTGDFIDEFIKPGAGGLLIPVALTFGPDNNLYVGSLGSNQVKRYNGRTGAFMDDFASGGDLAGPGGMVWGPDKNLYVTSVLSSEVKRYNGVSGQFMDTFVTAKSGSLSSPIDLAFGPDGNLYVSSRDTFAILRYNGTSGAFMDTFIPPLAGGLFLPHRVYFGGDGNLWVASTVTNQVKRFNAKTGAFVDTFVYCGPVVQDTWFTFSPNAFAAQ